MAIWSFPWHSCWTPTCPEQVFVQWLNTLGTKCIHSPWTNTVKSASRSRLNSSKMGSGTKGRSSDRVNVQFSSKLFLFLFQSPSVKLHQSPDRPTCEKHIRHWIKHIGYQLSLQEPFEEKENWFIVSSHKGYWGRRFDQSKLPKTTCSA